MDDQLRTKFEQHVLRRAPGECWGWCGTVQPGEGRGYGVIWHEGRMHKAYRVAWEALVGPLKAGERIYRGAACTDPACTNPEHLMGPRRASGAWASAWSAAVKKV